MKKKTRQVSMRAKEARERRAAARILAAEGREKLRALRAKLKAAKVAKRARIKALRETCRVERLALTAHLKEMRASALREITAKTTYQRQAARLACTQHKEAAKKNADDVIARARADIAAERHHQAEQKRITREHLQAKAEHKKRPHGHTDEEIRALIPSKLWPLYVQVQKKIRASKGRTRAEAFMHYAETHPEEVHAVLHPGEEREIKKTDEEIATTAKTTAKAVRAPNAYEVKRAQKIAGMRAKADRLKKESEASHARAHAISDVIPLGQPILVGHHSEKRHRRDIKRIKDGFSKSHELAANAQRLERRAANAEQNPAISSDDPDAIEKLRAKLLTLNVQRTKMQAVNGIIRAGGGLVELKRIGLSEEQARAAMEKDFVGRVGVPVYALQNAAAEAARIEKRIAELEARRTNPRPDDIAREGVRITEEENRVRIFFVNKPPALMRSELKGSGFKWAPSVQAWQRKASRGAWEAAKYIVFTPTRLPDE